MIEFFTGIAIVATLYGVYWSLTRGDGDAED